jgi:hypothetical protein
MTRRAHARAVAVALLVLASPSHAQSPSPSPRSKTPIADSVGPVVEEYLRRQRELCARAILEGLPCFPVSVEAEAAKPQYSVAESLRQWRAPGTEGPRGPAATSPYGTPIVGVTFDPVCAVKAIGNFLRGRNDTYYLYRVWGETGEQVIMREHPLDPNAYAAITSFRYELVAKIDGVCEAIAAWRKAEREAQERNAAGAKGN